MTELGEGTRALLDAARDGDEPRPEDRARVRAALALALAAPPNAAGGAKAAQNAARHQAAGSRVKSPTEPEILVGAGVTPSDATPRDSMQTSQWARLDSNQRRR